MEIAKNEINLNKMYYFYLAFNLYYYLTWKYNVVFPIFKLDSESKL